MLLLLKNKYIFHEHQPGRIYTIDEIVSHVVLTIINNKGHFGNVSSYNINEQWS
jgi:hypothetical protein